jgi:triosephosphate isomerase (TIM)
MAGAAGPEGRTPLMAGKWKMNLDHLQATHLVQKLDWKLRDARHDYGAVEVAVLPPFTDLRSVQTLVEADKLGLRFGAQDLSPYASGAYTGDISGAFLAKLGCTYVIVGHSERREGHGETDELVAAKVAAAYRHGLTPILCCGENLEVRRAGGQVAHVVRQLRTALSTVSPEQAQSLVIAYEPIWAIGTGEVATPEDAQEVCEAVRGLLAELYGGALAARVRVLYGGSVKGNNVAAIMAQPDVDGALVGGASIDPDEFATICRYREHVTGAAAAGLS